jgi:hypothetical protein
MVSLFNAEYFSKSNVVKVYLPANSISLYRIFSQGKTTKIHFTGDLFLYEDSEWKSTWIYFLIFILIVRISVS